MQSTSDFKIKKVLSDILPNALKKNLRPEAIKILDWHKNQGHRCLIVSSSPKPIILSLSKFLNMELIASECNDMKLVDSNNRFLLTSPNCKGSEKLIRLVNYLGFTSKLFLIKNKYIKLFESIFDLVIKQILIAKELKL